MSVVGISIPYGLELLAARICASTKSIPCMPVAKERRLAYAESKRVNPTSGANQHLVAPAGASFWDEAALILLRLLHLQVRLQMPR